MKKIISIICIAVMTASLLSGCGSDDGSSSVMSLFVNLDSDEILKVDDAICSLPEAMIVLMTEQNEYKEAFGDYDFDEEIGDTTVSEYIFSNVKYKLSVIYALCAMAEDEGIELTPEETETAETLADEYYNALNEDELEYTGATSDDVLNLVSSCILAKKVYSAVADENVTTEISDEQARVISIQYAYSSDRETLETLYEEAQTKYENFLVLAYMYSEDSTVELTLKRGDTTEEFEEVAFDLDTDEMSDILELDSGYYIIYCANSYLEDETAANKASLVAEAEYEAVSEIYDDYLDSASTLFNSSAWKKIELSDNENVSSTAFAEIYKSIFGE